MWILTPLRLDPSVKSNSLDKSILRFEYFLGPLFHHAFLSYRPHNWTKNDANYMKTNIVGTSGLHTNVIAASQNSAFMEFLLNSLRENFPTESATLYKTGPYFFKEAFLQYPFNDKIPLISHYFINSARATPDAILVDNPSDSMWHDKEGVLPHQWGLPS